MKLLKSLIITTALFAGFSAHAYPIHTLLCRVGAEPNVQSMYLEIEDSDLASGLGKITLSNWATDVSPKWVPFQQAQVQMKLTWAINPLTSKKIITGATVDMGRSGAIAVSTSGKPDQYNSSMTGVLKANAMGFNYPNGIETECGYFLIVGQKPGLTGSN